MWLLTTLVYGLIQGGIISAKDVVVMITAVAGVIVGVVSLLRMQASSTDDDKFFVWSAVGVIVPGIIIFYLTHA